MSDSKRLRELLSIKWKEFEDSQNLYDRPLPPLTPPNPQNNQFWSFTLLDPRYSNCAEAQNALKQQKTWESDIAWHMFLIQWFCNLPLPEDWIICQVPFLYTRKPKWKKGWDVDTYLDFCEQPVVRFNLAHYTCLDDPDFYAARSDFARLLAWIAVHYGFFETQTVTAPLSLITEERQPRPVLFQGISGFLRNDVMPQLLTLKTVVSHLESLCV